LLAFTFYSGFEALASVPFFDGLKIFLVNLGIDSHYQSVSRGVIDLRDIMYFLGLIVVFLGLTRLVLSSRRW